MSGRNKEGIGKKLFFPILFIILVFFILSFIKIDAIFIKSYFNGNIKKIEYLKDKDRFGIVYTHSVEKSQTSEWYEARDGKLILMEQRYRDQGAGLPVNLIYKFKYAEDGSFCLYDMNVPFDTVVYRTGAVIANHKFVINGKATPFLEFSEPREALEFSTKHISLLQYALRRCQIEQ
ncbi:DUF1850 domain-containing protein [Peptoniphilus sp. AGMB00490]|uniref:DUF1850 domain-containing protein n=1 Tax=Peptoniphilus faecalis TaxID=2731255 RepID=A0A848RN92_9FIRM|nr:DUF1850 domain-containing protein [Peptoniphilus faecalis]NMW85752.1 DUF1850 domain-containing protein [Peptoniphilus faecalis]